MPGHDPLTNLVFENNKGLFQNTQGNFRYYERDNSSSSSNKIEFNNSKTERIGVTVADEVKAVFDNKIIKLKSKTTGDYLYADGESVKIGPERTDATDEWEISYRPPFQYVLRNVNTGRYLEVEDAYTLNHIKNPGLKPRILVENKWSYPKGAKTPDWYLEFHSTSVGGGNFYELQPGGNEHKSSIINDNSGIAELSFSLKEDGSLGAVVLWEIEEAKQVLSVDTNFALEKQNIAVYPNPFSKRLTIAVPVALQLKQLELYNLQGVLVFSKDYLHTSNEENSIELPNLSKGSYILKISTKKEELTQIVVVK